MMGPLQPSLLITAASLDVLLLVYMNQLIADVDGSGGKVPPAPVGNKPVAAEYQFVNGW